MSGPVHRLPGARLEAGGGRFLLRAPHAESVELCLFKRASDRREATRIELRKAADGLWETWVDCLAEGQLYGYRVGGPWDPTRGMRFDPAKVLLDPWALRVGRAPCWHDALRAEDPDGRPDRRDSAPWAALGALVDLSDLPDVGIRPHHRAGSEVVYEAHLKGLTMLHPAVPPRERGTFAGAAHPAVLEHLRRMGVTTLELLPVQQHADDRFLVERGLTNFWGYSTLGYFAPHSEYACEPRRALAEFRAMVGAYHQAGIEVLLDVVYNHTCEGPFFGPQLSWRGMGPQWYRRRPHHPRLSEDFTGCGNTLDFRQRDVVRFTLESLGFWVQTGGVDGFRYDLASVMGRLDAGFQPDAPLLQAMASDPFLRQVKHVSEPWDATWDGYAVGKFPTGWRDWNDRFRDDMRRFWRGDAGAEFGFQARMTGSRDLFGDRPAHESLNFVACHDGSTLHDLCAYSRKHNEANQEGGRDGADHEVTDNHGFEGPTCDSDVLASRALRARNLLASTLLAPGTPMFLAGDELARTQQGNNNAYCQDNEISWMRWSAPPEGWPGPDWIGALTDLRRTLLEQARWESVPHLPGVVCLAWSSAHARGYLLAQAGGPMRSILLPGRLRRWLDTSSSSLPDPVQLPSGPCLLRPSSLVLLQRLR